MITYLLNVRPFLHVTVQPTSFVMEIKVFSFDTISYVEENKVFPAENKKLILFYHTH